MERNRFLTHDAGRDLHGGVIFPRLPMRYDHEAVERLSAVKEAVEEREMTEGERTMYAGRVGIYVSNIGNIFQFTKFCIALNSAAYGLLAIGIEKYEDQPVILVMLVAICVYFVGFSSLWRKGLAEAGIGITRLQQTIQDFEHMQRRSLASERAKRSGEPHSTFFLFQSIIRGFRWLWSLSALYIILLLLTNEKLYMIVPDKFNGLYNRFWKLYDWLHNLATGLLT